MDKLIAKLIKEERSPLLWQKNPPEIYLGSAGHIRMETGPATHPLTAYYIAVIWGIDGRIGVRTTEETYVLESGQVCLISHGTRFTVDIESAWGEFIYFSIDGKASEGILENYDLWQGVFPGGNAPLEVLDSILAGLPEIGKSVVRTNVVHVLDLLDIIRRRALRRAPDKAVREAEILIRRSFRDPSFNINRVCEQLKLHRSGLSKRFRNITGKTPRDYLHDIRIRTAEKMLEKTGMNISEIAYSCGFSDAGYFTRFLKKKTGRGPGEFRRDRRD